MSPLLYDVFGRRVEVERRQGRWEAYHPPRSGKRRPVVDLNIPPDLPAADLMGHLADLLHEEARPERSETAQLRSAGTVVFDFDSTLIVSESLELLVEPALERDKGLKAEFEAITRQGMEGNLGFGASLSARLELAKPTREDIQAFVDRLDALWTPGMPDLVADLRWRGVDVWLVSGALQDCLRPAAARLGVPSDRVRGVPTLWDETGALVGPDRRSPFSSSKVEGVRASGLGWDAPSVVVGDGATDRALVEAGLAGHFVAFIGNVAREPVTRGVPHVASNAEGLRDILDDLVP